MFEKKLHDFFITFILGALFKEEMVEKSLLENMVEVNCVELLKPSQEQINMSLLNIIS